MRINEFCNWKSYPPPNITLNHAKNTPILNKRNSLSVDFQLLSELSSWVTRIRTGNDRTKTCSVTITPSPNCGCKGNNFNSFQRKICHFFSFLIEDSQKTALFPMNFIPFLSHIYQIIILFTALNEQILSVNEVI